ncbi:YbgC/FadM family acyl-CoA thioesterase [Helicobacter cappadocius]|uniref:YbgC/FadM family acyl-CoA thioesterase n=1 Tax=Helicobacter cappadocius TaxID=3063998 RepID=A0AA90T554_9HELI|nr:MULTISPECIES: YbgC/FadM family acyl-CoA thioesterase [unclassified Helicobacter]MDO7252932.1 YbgC/FadM family acyl-CoA thioesterase [Helicobacter sp. faydin-H75]MDP2539078.1 YbgC/FadM family acyl-CoA thioesterase [Helicobacter sp. faydin-H76]
MQIRIYYEDTDCGGIVYHTNYIKYCERARSEELLFSEAFNPHKISNAFVVKNLKANFISSAKLGDKIEVRTEVLKIKPVTVVLKQEIYKIFDISSETLCEDKIFELEVKLGHIDLLTGKPTPITKTLLGVLNAR